MNKNIYILPTDKPSKLFYNVGGTLLYKSYQNHNGCNMYITNDEVVKGKCFGLEFDLLWKSPKVFQWDSDIQTSPESNCRKIILSTDPDLIADGVQAIENDFLEWFMKNSNCEFVEIAYENDTCLQGCDFNYYKIRIPAEEPKDVVLGYKTSLVAQTLDEIELKQSLNLKKLEEKLDESLEKEFVSYNLAMELKKLGFDETGKLVLQITSHFHGGKQHYFYRSGGYIGNTCLPKNLTSYINYMIDKEVKKVDKTISKLNKRKSQLLKHKSK